MLVSLNEFNNYSGNFEDDEQVTALKTNILKAAQELVNEYLRFNPEEEWVAQGIPSLIKLTILRIATLMLMEAGENIGVSGKSFADNSRSFISYTNYSKYLSPLQTFRKVIF